MRKLNYYVLSTAIAFTSVSINAFNANLETTTIKTASLGNISDFVTVTTTGSSNGTINIEIDSQIRDNARLRVINAGPTREFTLFADQSVPLARGKNNVSLEIGAGRSVAIIVSSANTSGSVRSTFTVPSAPVSGLGTISELVSVDASSSIRGNLNLKIDSSIRDNGSLSVLSNGTSVNGSFFPRPIPLVTNRSVPLARGINNLSLDLGLMAGQNITISFTSANTSDEISVTLDVPQFVANDIRSLVDLNVFTPARGRATIQLDSDLRDNANLLLINLSTAERTRQRVLLSRGESTIELDNLESGAYVVHLRSANTIRRVSKRFMVR